MKHIDRRSFFYKYTLSRLNVFDNKILPYNEYARHHRKHNVSPHRDEFLTHEHRNFCNYYIYNQDANNSQHYNQEIPTSQKIMCMNKLVVIITTTRFLLAHSFIISNRLTFLY